MNHKTERRIAASVNVGFSNSNHTTNNVSNNYNNTCTIIPSSSSSSLSPNSSVKKPLHKRTIVFSLNPDAIRSNRESNNNNPWKIDELDDVESMSYLEDSDNIMDEEERQEIIANLQGPRTSFFTRRNSIIDTAMIDQFQRSYVPQITFNVTQLFSTVILPSNKWKQRWDTLILILVAFIAFDVPFVWAFNVTPNLILNLVIDIIFLIDIVLSFRTTFKINGIYTKNIVEIREHYLKTWFFIDLISSLPLHAFFNIIHPNNSYSQYLVALTLLRLNKFGIILKKLKQLTPIAGFSILMSVFILIAHWAACFYPILHRLGLDFDDSMDSGNQTHSFGDDSDSYISLIYWSLSSLTTVGYGDIHATAISEKIYGCIIMILSAVVYCTIFSMISLIINDIYNVRMDDVKFKKQMQQNIQDMNYNKSFDTKFTKWINYCVQSKQKYSTSFVLKQDITSSMKQQIVKQNFSSILSVNTVLSNAPRAFILRFCSCLEFTVSLPHEYIIQENDFNQRIYLIRDGITRVFNKSDKEICRLYKGSYFGEIPFLAFNDSDTINQPKLSPIAVYSSTFTQLHYISDALFIQLIGAFPTLQFLLTQIAKARYEEMNHAYDDIVLVKNVYDRLRTKGIYSSEQINLNHKLATPRLQKK